MSIVAKTYYDSPIGTVEITASEVGIFSVDYVDYPTYEIDPGNENLLQCIEQLDEYFSGERTRFNLFLDLQGTEFQLRVWRQLQNIPMAKTMPYLEVAKLVKSPDAMRAVGAACGRNKHFIIVPCHRVISSDGKLTGYAGGLKRKRWLLEHEWGVLHGKQSELF